MDKVPELVKAAKEAEAAKEEKAAKDKTDKEKARLERIAAAVKSLESNAAGFLGFASSKPTDEAALEFATTLIKELAGETLPLAEAATLFDE